MGPHLPLEVLEALALGRSSPAGSGWPASPSPASDPAGSSEGAGAHLRGCDLCARELAWLHTELRLVARRKQASPPVPPSIWEGVAARLASAGTARVPVRAPRPLSSLASRRRLLGASLALAAAASIALVAHLRPPSRGPGSSAATGGKAAAGDLAASRDDLPAPAVTRALDRAELDYRAAAGVLETEYRTRHASFDASSAGTWEASLASARRQLDSARALAGDDVEARLRVLDGYAVYVRSLRAAVVSSEEAVP